MFGIDDVLTGGLSLFSGIMNNQMAGQRQNEQQNFNAQQAAVNREWQERMSNTSHQREAADLEAAGLNRILSVGKGASTPGGSTASSTAAPVHDALGPAVTTAMAHARLGQELENMKSEDHRIMKDTRLKIHQGNTESERTRTQAAETLRTLEDTKLKNTTAKHTAQEIVKGSADAVRATADTEQFKDSSAYRVLRQTGNLGEETQRASSALSNVFGLPGIAKDSFKKRFAPQGRVQNIEDYHIHIPPGGR